MSTSAIETYPLAQSVEFTDDDLIVSLVDGRKITVPIIWYPRLAAATNAQL
ncbi:MAG: DUF2442 domain-containing protein [Immundisolibacteraceae bacterium]|nr:DUF2442 domain-containing protein [Immundisolibacteraceae bacterium]